MPQTSTRNLPSGNTSTPPGLNYVQRGSSSEEGLARPHESLLKEIEKHCSSKKLYENCSQIECTIVVENNCGYFVSDVDYITHSEHWMLYTPVCLELEQMEKKIEKLEWYHYEQHQREA